jgi:hypothetical protein
LLKPLNVVVKGFSRVILCFVANPDFDQRGFCNAGWWTGSAATNQNVDMIAAKGVQEVEKVYDFFGCTKSGSKKVMAVRHHGLQPAALVPGIARNGSLKSIQAIVVVPSCLTLELTGAALFAASVLNELLGRLIG